MGILAEKIGMTTVFEKGGAMTPVTVLNTKPCIITAIKSLEKNGYAAVQLGLGKKKKASKAYAGIFKKENLASFSHLKEFRVDDISEYQVGQKIGVALFENVDFVDVSGISKGKGFQGVVKRYGFGGGPGSHGSHFHRAPGSIGNCSYPARVFKGKKMPGQMGFLRSTVQNLKVIDCDKENGLLLIKGAVPGKNKALVIVRESIKKANQKAKA